MKPLEKKPETRSTSADRMNMLSHELRTPLAIISGYSEVLEEEAGEQLQHLTRPIRDAIVRMQHVVDSLVEFETARSQETPAEVVTLVEGSRIPLNHLLRKAVQKVQRRHAQSRVSIQLQIRDSESLSTHVADALGTALNHVLDNAIKFAERRVRVSTSTIDGNLSISITDDGPGLPDKSVAVFSPFQQGTTGLSRDQAGLGMGLFLAKRSLSQVTGRIQLANNNGMPGTKATIVVPIATASPLRRAA